jgi:glycosyltransferase involved in cell wall biosynthesis
MYETPINFERWAVVGHKDDTGLGRMAEDFKKVLNIRRHIVMPSERLTNKPLDFPQEVELSSTDSRARVREVIQDMQGIIFFERPNWHPHLLEVAREMEVFTVCVPMWEWFNPNVEQWNFCDLFVCPNQHCYKVLQRMGYQNSTVLPTSLDLSLFPLRHIEGPARTFVHNAGLVDADDRKGTRDVVKAFHKVKRQDARLIVRMQKEAPLPEESQDKRIEVRIGNLDNPASLYQEGDVAVQPSKMEGIGFMVLEPVCCGLPVITLDHGPMNEFVCQPEMRARKRPFARRAYATNWIKHAHLRLPSIKDLTRKMEWCAENDLSNISRANRLWAEETFSPERLRRAWAETLQKNLLRSANATCIGVSEPK